MFQIELDAYALLSLALVGGFLWTLGGLLARRLWKIGLRWQRREQNTWLP